MLKNCTSNNKGKRGKKQAKLLLVPCYILINIYNTIISKYVLLSKGPHLSSWKEMMCIYLSMSYQVS